MSAFYFLSMFFWFQSKPAKVYSREENLCSVTYATVKQWTLELKEQGFFTLTYKEMVTRRRKTSSFNTMGTWVNKNDTIVLISASPIYNDCYFQEVKYVVSKDGMTLIGSSVCLPERLKAGDWLTFKL